MSETEKPKFGMYWTSGCGGCEIAVLNIHEKILDVDKNFEIVFWPVAMDGKTKDVEALPDGAITLMLINGGIRNSDNEEMVKLLRRKSKIVVAFGSCAAEGCIPGLANFSTIDQIFETSYASPSTNNPEGIRPQPVFQVQEGELHIPEFYPYVRTLEQVIPVDYTIPGCPPESAQIGAVIDLVISALKGEAALPKAGSTIGAGNSTVCDECKRTRNVKLIKSFKRVQDIQVIDPELCLLEQGIPCNGPATRSGCNARCPSASAQCIGCYGPAEGVIDYGARLMTAFASVIDSNDPVEIKKIVDTLPDPAGQFYRFNLASSLLHMSKQAWQNQKEAK
jgi:F420-non-reducing hydrogenase small subunit